VIDLTIRDTMRDVWPVVGIVFSVLGSLYVAKLSNKATDRKTQTESAINAGELALQIANRADTRSRRADSRIESLEAWRVAVIHDWYPAHHARDNAIETELRKLDPSFPLPPEAPMPRYVPPVHTTGDESAA
jgi:hypothetical protein